MEGVFCMTIVTQEYVDRLRKDANEVHRLSILDSYERIMAEEAKLSPLNWRIVDAEEMFNTVQQIREVAANCRVLRSYNWNYNVTDQRVAYESDGAHTNLLAAIVDRALCYRYGACFNYTEDGYSYREVMEAIRRHDLPENITGDIPDDGNRDESAKTTDDFAYWCDYGWLSPSREVESELKIGCLLSEMEGKTSPTGKLIYVADKAAAIFITLYYDSIGLTPHKLINASDLTERDIAEMALCEMVIIGKEGIESCLASEMWTLDFFKMRSIADYDDTGFFTALVVMYTLQAHHDKWYYWREQEYSSAYYS